MKIYTLRMRAGDRDIFDAIRSGTKKVETRAATVRNRMMKAGDEVIFSCGAQKLKKTIVKVSAYKTIKAMLKDYRISEIAPGLKTESELRDMYFAWPAYRNKIKKFGLIVSELK